MSKRKAWNGSSPSTPTDARRILLESATKCVERLGRRAGLTDVALEAGVTRQTVYRYFEDTEDLFRSAAALASGGFLERMRAQVRTRETLVEQVVECMVFTIRGLSSDPNLGNITPDDDMFSLSSMLELGFVQEEVRLLTDGNPGMTTQQLDELAELLVRLLHSFLEEPGVDRSEDELRTVLATWLKPLLLSLTS